MSSQQVPEGRYGSRARRPDRPRVRWALGALTALVLIGASVLAYTNLGSPPIQGEQAAFQVLDDSSVQVTAEVQRDDPRRPAECVIRALGVSGAETGRKEIYIPPADDTVRQETVVRTSERPMTGEVYGCTYNVPEYLSTLRRPTG